MSLVACISRCPATTRSPWFSNSLGPRNSSSTDASASFICRKQRVLSVVAEHQRNPGARADAPHPDDLAREVGQVELLEQHAPVVHERFAVGAQEFAQPVEHLIALAALQEVVDRHDQRRFGDDPRLAIHDTRQFGERRHAVPRTRLGQSSSRSS